MVLCLITAGSGGEEEIGKVDFGGPQPYIVFMIPKPSLTTLYHAMRLLVSFCAVL